ncbi:MAG: ATP-dependent helicase [Gemmatimonadetes bacterium]|nr:ATP-dependent helicase [Gemmatimonadota bacterium]
MADAPRVYRQRERQVDARAEGAPDHLDGLNDEQRLAATASGAPLLIVAGAGTGKTRTLVHRVAHLIETGVRPERILLLTYTRRAAQEMLSRAERLVGSASRSVQGGTFHATANRLLRRFGPAAGLPGDFTIMDQGDAEDLMQIARATLGVAQRNKRFPKKETLQYLYSRHVNTERSLDALLHDEFPAFVDWQKDIERVWGDYTRRKAERNLVDYDDLLLFWALMLDQSPELGARIASMHDHVLVDEYQDTNALQSRILRGLCGANGRLTVVGDDAQSVYSFRGATVRNMLDFPAQFTGARVVTLERNYRSTAPILDCTNALISRASERYSKRLWTARTGGEKPWLVAARDESQQTRFVADRILELHEEGVPLREMAVLFRAGYMSADLEIELARRKIPFDKWGGLRFLEAAHVKDVLAFLRILENPRDEVSWYRILLLMPGIGETTARAAIETMAQLAWDSGAFGRYAPPPRARPAHDALVALLEAMRNATPTDYAQVSADIARVRTMYDELLRDKYDRPEPRLADLDQLQVIAAGYPSRLEFLNAIALEPPQGTQDLAAGGADQEDDVLVLSTAHSAKGREWDVVFVIWAVDGFFPLARAIGDDDQVDEERRLMYVAMTRARNHLFVTYPIHTYGTRRGADYTMDQLSRFLDRGVRETMERVALGDNDATAPPDTSPPAQPVDLRALLRGRFNA